LEDDFFHVGAVKFPGGMSIFLGEGRFHEKNPITVRCPAVEKFLQNQFAPATQEPAGMGMVDASKTI